MWRQVAADINSLPPDVRTRQYTSAIVKSAQAMYRWCEANMASCARQREEVEPRGCALIPGVVTYTLNRKLSWTVNCTNTTLMLPGKC